MKEISVQDFKTKLRQGSITAIDVREAWEFDEYNVDTINISVYELPHRIEELHQYKNEPIVVFCKTGKRGGQAQKILLQNGFSEVMNLTGGIESLLPQNA